jgi:hypothetical protein
VRFNFLNECFCWCHVIGFAMGSGSLDSSDFSSAIPVPHRCIEWSRDCSRLEFRGR